LLWAGWLRVNMHEFLAALEQGSVGTWVRESPSIFAYTGLITVHAIGLAFAVGFSWATALRALGVAPRVPLAAMEDLFGVVWVGFWLCAVSGVALAIGHATTDLTSPVFFTKLSLIAFGVVFTRRLKQQVSAGPSRVLAGVVIAVWAGAIVAGRLNEYPALMGLPR